MGPIRRTNLGLSTCAIVGLGKPRGPERCENRGAHEGYPEILRRQHGGFDSRTLSGGDV